MLEGKLEIRRLGSNLGVPIEELCALGQISTSLGPCLKLGGTAPANEKPDLFYTPAHDTVAFI